MMEVERSVSSPAAFTLNGIQAMVSKTRMECRTRRTDCWVEIGDGHYRLALGRHLTQIEHNTGRGVFATYGRVARGRYENAGQHFGFATEGIASKSECREIVLIALVGGRTAVINGRQIAVDSKVARELVELHVDHAPAIVLWDLAYVALHCLVEGRETTEEEWASHRPLIDVIPPVPVNNPLEHLL